MHTGIGGSVNSTLCNAPRYISADCGGPDPQIDCPCCIKCCDHASRSCEDYPDLFCTTVELQARKAGRISSCQCGEQIAFGGFCNHKEKSCESCNEDGTVCGFNLRFGYTEVHPTYSWKKYENTFQYSLSRNDTVDWHETPDVDCQVWVNGEQCNTCDVHRCRDGYPARYIDCTNVVSGADGVYDTCQHYDTGGVFDVISWWDTRTWQGCFPVLYQWKVRRIFFED